MFNVMESLFGRRMFSRSLSKRAQVLSRAADGAVPGLEVLERRMFLSATAPITWDGQVKTAYADEWVLKLSDSYLQQSAKAAANGISDADLGPFTTLIEDGGYNISDASTERAPNNSGYAILHAPFTKSDAIESWGDSLMQDNAIMHTPAAFESVSPYFTDMVIPSNAGAPAAAATGPGVNIIGTDPSDPNVVNIEWAGLSGRAMKDQWSVTFSQAFVAAHDANDLSQTAVVQALENFGVVDARIDRPDGTLAGHARLLAPLSDEPGIRQWADAMPDILSFSPIWVDQPEGPAAPGGPDPIPAEITWNGQTANAADGQWSITFTSAFTSENPGNDLTNSDVFQSLSAMGITDARLIRIGSGSGAYIGRLYVPFSESAKVAAWQQANSSDVAAVSPDWMIYASALPNDTDFGDLWAFNNTGQTVNGVTGTSGVDISASEAWDNTTGDPNVVVAVIDDGINYSHPDLDGNMWSGTGRDTHDGDNIPYSSSQNHGTHVAGIIGAEGNNSLGVTGVAQATQLMAVKIYSDTGTGTTTDMANGIQWAVDELNNLGVNVRIMNISSSSTGLDSNLTTAVGNAQSAGILIVASAGNSTSNNDTTPAYPASYTNANIISVAATTGTDTLSSYSNYGHTSVDLGAPGDNIYSTWSGSSYFFDSGTSMSSPMVAGTAALVISAWPSATVADVKAAILNHVDSDSNLSGITVTGGRLDAAQSLRNEKLLVGALDNAVAYDGNILHLAYFDNSSKHLYYVQRNSSGFWSAPVLVDSTSTEVGRYVSISVDSGGGIGLAYYDAFNADLRYAYSTTGSSWTNGLVHSSSISGLYPSLQFDGTSPAIAYYRAGTVTDLWFAEKTSPVPSVGSWTLSAAVTSTGDVGRYPSLAADPNTGQKWAVTYEDTTNGDLRYATETTGGVWSNALVDNLVGGAPYSSLKFNGTTASVSFYDANNANLIYATRSGGGTWSTQTVASTGTVGLYTQLLLDGANPVIIYYKSNTDELFEAELSGGTWNYTTLESGGGGLVSAGLTAGGHLGYAWYDTSEADIQFVEN